MISAAVLNSLHPLSKTVLHLSVLFSNVAKVLAGEKKKVCLQGNKGQFC